MLDGVKIAKIRRLGLINRPKGILLLFLYKKFSFHIFLLILGKII